MTNHNGVTKREPQNLLTTFGSDILNDKKNIPSKQVVCIELLKLFYFSRQLLTFQDRDHSTDDARSNPEDHEPEQ